MGYEQRVSGPQPVPVRSSRKAESQRGGPFSHPGPPRDPLHTICEGGVSSSYRYACKGIRPVANREGSMQPRQGSWLEHPKTQVPWSPGSKVAGTQQAQWTPLSPGLQGSPQLDVIVPWDWSKPGRCTGICVCKQAGRAPCSRLPCYHCPGMPRPARKPSGPISRHLGQLHPGSDGFQPCKSSSHIGQGSEAAVGSSRHVHWGTGQPLSGGHTDRRHPLFLPFPWSLSS